MATEYTTIEVWVRINECGDWDVGSSPEEAAERFEQAIGTDGATGYRMVKLTVKVPLPTTIELTGEVTVDETETALKVS